MGLGTKILPPPGGGVSLLRQSPSACLPKSLPPWAVVRKVSFVGLVFARATKCAHTKILKGTEAFEALFETGTAAQSEQLEQVPVHVRTCSDIPPQLGIAVANSSAKYPFSQVGTWHTPVMHVPFHPEGSRG